LAATHRKAIPASRQRLTVRVTGRWGPSCSGRCWYRRAIDEAPSQLQPDDSQDFVEAFEHAGRYAGPVLVEADADRMLARADVSGNLQQKTRKRSCGMVRAKQST